MVCAFRRKFIMIAIMIRVMKIMRLIMITKMMLNDYYNDIENTNGLMIICLDHNDNCNDLRSLIIE